LAQAIAIGRQDWQSNGIYHSITGTEKDWYSKGLVVLMSDIQMFIVCIYNVEIGSWLVTQQTT
jgi:hypothetical protein